MAPNCTPREAPGHRISIYFNVDVEHLEHSGPCMRGDLATLAGDVMTLLDNLEAGPDHPRIVPVYTRLPSIPQETWGLSELYPDPGINDGQSADRTFALPGLMTPQIEHV